MYSEWTIPKSLLLVAPHIIAALLTPSAQAGVFRCPDANGNVSYQQQPCEHGGTKLNVTPANGEVSSDQQPSVAPSPVAGPKVDPTPSVARPNDDRYAGYQDAAYGLTPGLTLHGVIERWGLPTDTRTERNWTFLHWCDMRVALLIDGRLRAWDAPFKDSKAGTSLFSYGEMWIQASIRWGQKYKVTSFSDPRIGRGETRKWGDLRWVVVDSHGGIVGWCDAAEHRAAVRPPAFNPPWDNPMR